MLFTSIFRVLLLTLVMLGTPILGADGYFPSGAAVGADAVSTASASAASGTASSSASSATASISSSSTLSGERAFALTPAHYDSLQTAPVVQNVQTVQHIPVVPNYQTIQQVPVVQQQLPANIYGGGYGGFGSVRGAISGTGLGGGFRRYRESYIYKTRGFGGGLNAFGRLGFGGGRFKAHYSSGGVAVGGFAGI